MKNKPPEDTLRLYTLPKDVSMLAELVLTIYPVEDIAALHDILCSHLLDGLAGAKDLH